MTPILKSKTVLSTVTHYSEEDIVHVHFTSTTFLLNDLIQHYAELESIVSKKPSDFIYSFESMWLKPLTHEARIYNNVMLAGLTKSLTAVAPSPMLKSFVNFYIRISNLPFPAKACGSLSECKAFLAADEAKIKDRLTLKSA